MSLISRLSSYEIRSHYIVYTSIKHVFNGSDADLTTAIGRRISRVFIPLSTYETAMEFTTDENAASITEYVMPGLLRERLIGQEFATGPLEHLQRLCLNAPSDGVVVEPSVLGVELILRASGRSSLSVKDYLKLTTLFEPYKDVDLNTTGIISGI
jgi:hypothetical protein